MGRVYRPKYNVKGLVCTAKNWYVEYTDFDGKTRHKKAATTKKDALVLLRICEKNALKKRHNIPIDTNPKYPRLKEYLRTIDASQDFLDEWKESVYLA